MGFTPGTPLKCSMHIFPDPPENTGLEKVTTKPVELNGFGEYRCRSSDLPVTNDGLVFKLRCLGSGKFQSRSWLTCRKRATCQKSAPWPPFESGLAPSPTKGVLEFDSAEYSCLDPTKFVPDTPDGKFRAQCKRDGVYAHPKAIEWPTCVPKPSAAQVCQPQMAPPIGYARVGPDLFYVPLGATAEFRCVEPDYIAGDQLTIAYICSGNGTGSGVNVFKPLTFSGDAAPKCRAPATCALHKLPVPQVGSGLTAQQVLGSVLELQYVEYNCQRVRAYQLTNRGHVNVSYIYIL